MIDEFAPYVVTSVHPMSREAISRKCESAAAALLYASELISKEQIQFYEIIVLGQRQKIFTYQQLARRIKERTKECLDALDQAS